MDIKEIESETNILYKKQSWIKKALKDLIEKLNDNINIEKNGNVKIYIDLPASINIEYDLYDSYVLSYQNGIFDIMLENEQYFDHTSEHDYYTTTIEEINPAHCRKIIKYLPEALNKVLERLKEINSSYNEVDDIVNKINEVL